MDIISAIKTRRSVRDFLDKPISDKVLFKILDLANYSPAAGGLYNWKFIIVKGKEDKELLADASYGQEFVKDSAVVIIICSDDTYLKREFGKKGEQYAVQNTAVAVSNLMLAAHSFGIGSCWAGLEKEKAVREALNVPDNIDIHALVALGYAKRVPKIPSKGDLSVITFFDKWNNRIKKSSPLFPLFSGLEDRANKTAKKLKRKIRKKKK